MKIPGSLPTPKTFGILSFAMIVACLFSVTTYSQNARLLPSPAHVHASGGTIEARFPVPSGYTRISVTPGSFGDYLRHKKLKPDGSLVHYFNGKTKDANGIYVAVVDLPIGNRDLQQCADFIMHIRADYLYENHREDKIHFTLTNGFRADYTHWKDGYRISLSGNKTSWVKTAPPGNSFKSFSAYMDVIYTYCGTLSLSRELKKVNFKELAVGDILIRGGSPGHAELVMDIAIDKNGRKVYLLAQSYMPAQEMQVLINPENPGLSPWYEADESKVSIITPQWNFTTDQLMRFQDN